MNARSMRPSLDDYREILRSVAAWEVQFPGFYGRFQDAICRAAPDCDRALIDEANRFDYRPVSTDKPGHLREAEIEAAR